MDSNQIVPLNSVNWVKQAHRPADKSKINQKFADELLSLIFKFCLPHSDPASPNSIVFVPQSDEGAPFTLLFVCHRWRAVALVSSRLWRDVQVPSLGCNSGAFTNKAMSNQLKSLRQWLSFSRKLPLSIKCISHEFILSGSGHHYDYPPFLVSNSNPNRHVWNILLAFMEEESRWTAFDVVFDYHLLDKFISSLQLRQSTCVAAKLTYLKVFFEGLYTYTDASNVKKLFTWIKTLPALQTLIINDHHLLPATGLLENLNVLPFEKMAYVEFSQFEMTATNGAHIFSSCVSARDARLSGHNLLNYPQEYRDMMSINLPPTFAFMSRLSLRGIQFPTSLISQSIFPVLEYLEIVSCIEGSPVSASSQLSHFLRTSGAPLKTLIIHSRTMGARESFALLSLPDLQCVPCVDIYFEMSIPSGVNAIMTHSKYQWFRDGPNFIVWKYDAHDNGSHFGWKVLGDGEILEWELKEGSSYHHLESYGAAEIL